MAIARHGRPKHAARHRASQKQDAVARAAWAFAAWLAFVFLTGGGSRHDIESLVYLRPIALIVIAASIWFLPRGALAQIRTPLVLLIALALLMAAQLVPLPPDIWTGLWNREIVAEISRTIGVGDAWRPLTLSPMKTENSLASLAVPLATLLLFSLVPQQNRRVIWWTILGAALLSAVIGLAQTALGARGLYFYRITNIGDAVGLFSNRNHNAVFLAISVLICTRLSFAPLRQQNWPQVAGLAIAALFLTLVTLVNGSRAGLLCLVASWALALGWLLLSLPRLGLSAKLLRFSRIAAGVFAAGVAALAVLLVATGRSGSASRLAATSDIEELRLQVLPTLLDMTATTQPFGIGFGAFEYAYRMVEPAELLGPAYFNNAHNDWLQIAIEGGVPGILIALVTGFVVLRGGWRLLGSLRDPAAADGRRDDALLAFLSLAIFAVASIVDYPLRTPSMMAFAIVLLALVCAPALNRRDGISHDGRGAEEGAALKQKDGK